MPENSINQPFDNQKSIVDFLKKTRMFSPLSDELLWKLSPFLKYQQLNKSHPITREGEPNSRIFLLIQGQVALYSSGKLDRVKEAEEVADPIKLGRAAHQLKSNCLTFGAMKMVEICENLELAAETYELQETELLVLQLMDEGKKVEKILGVESRKKRL